jgi:XTP/dITP diphosphohydrolase
MNDTSPNPPFVLVLGTRNAKKRRELEYLLAPYPQIQLKTLDDFPSSIEVEETGDTFAANAALKATEQAKVIGQFVVGEDSGLSVAAMDGRPGIYSARYSGPDATDESNRKKLIEELAGVPADQRSAWYTCHMTLSDPDGNILIDCEAECHGRILDAERGAAGFGYDPLFEIPEYSLTFAELGDEFKSVLSHRARANRIFIPMLLSLIQSMNRAT